MNVNNQDKSGEPESASYQKKTQALIMAICFIFYVIAFPTLVISMKENFDFLSNPQTRAKLFYSSLYSMCGSLLASLILLIFKSSEKKGCYEVIALLLFSFCPLAVRFLDYKLAITHGTFTALWIQVNTLSYTSMLFLSVPVSTVVTYVIWKSGLHIKDSGSINVA
jgi:hypothetical protein